MLVSAYKYRENKAKTCRFCTVFEAEKMCIMVNSPFWRKKRRPLLHYIDWLSSEFF
ncbi:hypothetical protein MY7_1739 [Bacillus sp. 5B6]|nr:hypothetical protein MY7_1739 [Bacillus sp. 5B6]